MPLNARLVAPPCGRCGHRRVGTRSVTSTSQVVSEWPAPGQPRPQVRDRNQTNPGRCDLNVEESAPRRLRSTLYRWFEADPQAWWEYVDRVYKTHSSEAVRESARGLLWVDKLAADLQVGDINHHGGHVLGLRRQGGGVRVDTGDGSSTTFGSGATMVSVNRGWCPRGGDCPNCSIQDGCS